MKLLVKLLGGLVVLLIVAVVVVYFSLNVIVGRTITTLAPRLTRTPVSISLVSISPFTGEGVIRGLRIDSPAGYKIQPAISLGRVHVKINIKSLLTDRVIIEEVTVDAPAVSIEQKLLDNNISDIRKNVKESAATVAATNDKNAKGTRKFQINHLLITNGQAKYGLGEAQALFPIATIDRRNIGTREGGITSSEITNIVITAFTDSILQGLANGSFLKQGTKSIGDGIQGLFGR
jgi:hypothetical protein